MWFASLAKTSDVMAARVLVAAAAVVSLGLASGCAPRQGSTPWIENGRPQGEIQVEPYGEDGSLWLYYAGEQRPTARLVRVERRVGAEDVSTAVSATEYVYDPSGRLIAE